MAICLNIGTLMAVPGRISIELAKLVAIWSTKLGCVEPDYNTRSVQSHVQYRIHNDSIANETRQRTLARLGT